MNSDWKLIAHDAAPAMLLTHGAPDSLIEFSAIGILSLERGALNQAGNMLIST